MDNVYYSCSEEMQEDVVISRSLAPGTLIDGKYEITSVLGEGGMGTIYSAEQKELRRKVIIKTLQINRSTQEGAILRFEREAKLLGNLQHEHLVQVYSSGVINDQLPYIAMEFINGRTLSGEIKATGRLSWLRSCQIGKQICEAMQYAHAQGIIHRDLKPPNVLLLDEPHPDYVKVIDFGLGSFFDASGQQTITDTGALIGSPEYMSPETCSGLKSDTRSDIYSLGCMLYECLTGAPPFVSDNPIGLLYRHKNELPAKPSKIITESVPQELDAVILKALEKAPEARFQSMEEFATALDAVLQNKTLNFDVSQFSSARTRAEKSEPFRVANPAIVFLVLFGVAIITLPIFLKIKDINSKNHSTQSKDQLAIGLLHQVADLKQKALEARKQGAQKKAVESAEKSLRLLIKELVSARDTAALQQQELSTIENFGELSPLLIKPEGQKQLESMQKARDLEIHSGSYHNVGMLSLMSAILFEEALNMYSATENYCQAIEAFGKSEDFELANRIADQAISKLAGSNDEGPAFVRSKLELSRALVLIEQKKVAEAMEIASRELQRSSGIKTEELPSIYLQFAQLYERAGRINDAEKFYKKTIQLIDIRHGDFPKAWRGLARIYEEQNRIDEAIEAYKQIRNHAYNHADYPNMNQTEDKLARLQSKSHVVP